MSLLEGEGVLFSGDAFGACSVPEAFTDDGADFNAYARFMRKRFATVIGRYRSRVLKALDRLSGQGSRL